MVLYTTCSKNGRATDLAPRNAFTRLEKLYRTLTGKLFRETQYLASQIHYSCLRRAPRSVHDHITSHHIISRHTYACMHTRMHTCTLHTGIHAYMHTCVHAYIHTYVHTYIRTYIRTYIQNKWTMRIARHISIFSGQDRRRNSGRAQI